MQQTTAGQKQMGIFKPPDWSRFRLALGYIVLAAGSGVFLVSDQVEGLGLLLGLLGFALLLSSQRRGDELPDEDAPRARQ